MHLVPHTALETKEGRRSGLGFSLIELLAVIGVVVLVAVFMTPAVNSLISSQGVGSGGREIVAFLEFARSEAVARQTYVLVGFKEDSSGDRPVVSMGGVYSADGTGSNQVASNWLPLSRPVQMKGLALRAWNEISQETKERLTNPLAAQPADLPPPSDASKFLIGQTTFDRLIAFHPQGTVSATAINSASSPFTPTVAVGIVQMRGPSDTSGADAAVLIDGAVGASRFIQP